MFYLMIPFPIVTIYLLTRLASRTRFGLKGLALHPFNLIGLFIAIIALNFIAVYEKVAAGGASYVLEYAVSSPSDVTAGFFYFNLCSLAVLAGVAYGSSVIRSGVVTPVRDPVENVLTQADQRAATVTFAIAIGAALVVFSLILIEGLHRGNLLYVASIRQTWFRKTPILEMMISLVVPAFFLFGSRQQNIYGLRPQSLLKPALAALFCIALFSLVGSRSDALYFIVALAYWASRFVALSPLVIYLSLPIVAQVLLLYRYFAREAGHFSSFGQFLYVHGGPFGALFDTSDLSMAQTITVNITNSIVQRTPWDSFAGVLMLPVPRAFAPWKPLGASAEFSMVSDPLRWNLVQSEWTVTGFVDLYYSFGYVFSIVITFALAALMTRWLIRAARTATGAAVAGPFAIPMIVVFFRADIYNLAIYLWPLAAVILLHIVLKRLFARTFEVRSRIRTTPHGVKNHGPISPRISS